MAERISEKKKIEDAFDGQSSYQLHRASIHRNEINVMYENPLFDGITKIESDDNKKRKNNNNRGMFITKAGHRAGINNDLECRNETEQIYRIDKDNLFYIACERSTHASVTIDCTASDYIS